MKKRNFSYGARKSARAESVTITDGKKCAIAKLVRSIEFRGGTGGTCFLRALSGLIVLERFGIDAQLVLGGLLYRAGRNPWDIVFFAQNDDNKGHHPGLYHCWLEVGEDLVDFSSGDWRTMAESNVGEMNPLNLPPIIWEKEPPDFIWQPRAPLKQVWRPVPYGPKLGQAWYGPLAEKDEEGFWEAKAEMEPILIEAIDKVFFKWHLPVSKIFPNIEERDAYMKQIGAKHPKAAFVLIDAKEKAAGV